MTSRVLLQRARIDDADGGIAQMLLEPICFGKKMGVHIATLMQRYDNHDFAPPEKFSKTDVGLTHLR